MPVRLLLFFTGSSCVFLQGFRALQGSTGAVGPRLYQTHNPRCAYIHFFDFILDRYQLLYDKLTRLAEETFGLAVE